MTRQLAYGWGAFLLLAAGCGKGGAGADGGVNTSTGSGSGGTEAAERPALELVSETFSFPVQRSEDMRAMSLVASIPVPKGWAPDPKASPGPTMKTLIAPGDATKSMFEMSNLTISATCHGQCTQDKFPDQIKGAAKQQFEWAVGGAKKKITKDEELRPGVWGFVIEAPDAVTFGVTHWQKGWPYALFCNGLFQKDFAGAWEAAFKACADAKVDLEDPLMPPKVAAAEVTNLGKCPQQNVLTFTPSEAREGQPASFGDVAKVMASASRPAAVQIYIANFDMAAPPTRETPFQGEQRALNLWLFFEKKGDKEGEVLSGIYPVKYGGELRADPGLVIAGGTTLQWDPYSTEGQVEIVARTADKICGTIKLSGGNRGALEGTFAADLRIGNFR